MVLSPEVKGAIDTLLLTVITGITTVVLPLAYRLGKAWITAKIEAEAARVAAVQDERLRAADEARLKLVEYAFKRVDFVVSNTVAEIAQTSETNSGLTVAEKKARLALAYKRVKQQLPQHLIDALSGGVNDLNRYLITKIEADRFEQKQKATGCG